MELINATLTVRREFIDAIGDPLCSITGNNFDAGKLFLWPILIERLQNRFSVPLSRPDDRVRIIVNNDRGVFVTFL